MFFSAALIICGVGIEGQSPVGHINNLVDQDAINTHIFCLTVSMNTKVALRIIHTNMTPVALRTGLVLTYIHYFL